MAIAFKRFDEACYGAHAAARPVIGSRTNLRRFTRSDLMAWIEHQYTAANTVVAVAGDVDAAQIMAAAQAAFGDMPRGRDNVIAAPAFIGGIRSRRLRDSSQAHVVVGFPIPPLSGDHVACVVAAALLGEGMSSPLLDRVRERRGLVYHADCWTDVRDAFGQFVIEASSAPELLVEYASEMSHLLREQAEAIDSIGLERARNQSAVRVLGEWETPAQRLERVALDLFALGRVRSRDELLASITAVTATQVREAFQRMLDAGAAVGIAGNIAQGEAERVARLVGGARDEASGA
jgi:predicted Zn-dependent peptidase